MIARFWVRNGWTVWHAALAAVLVFIGVYVCRVAWGDILLIALNDEESSHILLVPIIAGWLVWVRRERLRYCQPTGQEVGPLILFIGAMLSVIGYYNAAQALWHGGAVIVFIGCVVTALGMDVVRKFLPAFLILGFIVPVPGFIRQQIAGPLQEQLAMLTQHAFVVLGEEVQRNGNMLIINGAEVAIAEACNGLRMVFALVMVSFAFAFGTPLRPSVRLLIVAASLVSAMFCNLIRMIPTVWLFGASGESGFEWLVFKILQGLNAVMLPIGLAKPYDKQMEAHFFHDVAGWIMLIFAFLLLMAIIRLLRWALIPVSPYTLAWD
jgi:exosortase